MVDKSSWTLCWICLDKPVCLSQETEIWSQLVIQRLTKVFQQVFVFVMYYIILRISLKCLGVLILFHTFSHLLQAHWSIWLTAERTQWDSIQLYFIDNDGPHNRTRTQDCMQTLKNTRKYILYLMTVIGIEWNFWCVRKLFSITVLIHGESIGNIRQLIFLLTLCNVLG